MTDTTSEAPLAQRHPWFLELYAALLADPNTPVAERFAAVDASDPVEAALALYLAALSAQSTGDLTLLKAPRGTAMRDLVATRLDRELQPSLNTFSDTWVVALWAAALRETNHLLRDATLTRLVGRVKNHVYARHTRAGSLMSSSDRVTLDFDVLLAAVPFGLFDCEDLVLVDSVRTLTADRLAQATPTDRMLLAWYFAEQGSYSKSRKIVAETDAPAFKPIVSQRLKTLGQLNARFIRHAPEGNGNRYEPLIEERFPKLITETDDVIVRAQAAPLSADEPLELVSGGDIIPGRFKGDSWEFTLPHHPTGSIIDYAIRFRRFPDERTETFRYEVLSRHELSGILAVEPLNEKLAIYATNGKLQIAPGRDGALRLDIVPGGPVSIDGVAADSAWPVGGFECLLRVAPFSLTLRKDDRDLATVTSITWLQSADGAIREISLGLAHQPCGFYGFGERYNALDQAGNRVDQFVYNQYKEQGLRTYIPMPVAYTDSGFGLHLATDSYSWFDLANPGASRLGVEADCLTIDLFSGAISDQISQFMSATGKPEPVPAWALGPWMSSNNWDSEAEVRKQVALTLEHGIPATVLVIEAWSDEATFYIWNDAQYAEKPGSEAFAYDDFTFPEWGRWPDPKGLADHLHDNALKLILWQIPIIKQSAALKHAQKRRDEAHFFERGFGVSHPDGTPLRLPEGWFKDSLLMDFTNAEGRDWWFAKRQYLIDDLGVDGFKTDGGEMVWGKDLRFSDGTTGLTNRNAYPRDYISAYYRFAQQNNGICFSRAGYTGAQTFPAHWAGDERSTWDAFKRSILAGLSAGMSGVIFWGWDLGGFSGEVPGAELYVRSAQMACFCPIMQYHAESKAEFNQDRTPWNIAERSGDPRALTGYAFYANLRMSLMPYLTREAAHCVAAKQPLMRAMILDHQSDPLAAPLWDQYMFGRDLLVAPVIREGETSRDVYLPAGRWWHVFQNRWFDGGQPHHIAAPFEEIPVFLRENSALPLRFHHDIRLGATMPSDIDAADISVLLVTGDVSLDGIEIMQSNGVVQVKTDRPILLLFADTPTRIEHNGVTLPIGTHNLSGKPLAAVQISGR
jgi:alpha-D-xyloside xylohydrolase